MAVGGLWGWECVDVWRLEGYLRELGWWGVILLVSLCGGEGGRWWGGAINVNKIMVKR